MYLQQPHLSCVELKRVHDFLRKVQVGVEGLLEVADWTNDVSLLLCHRLILESCRDRLDVDGSQSRLVHQREMLEMLRELYEKTQTQHPQHESLLHNVRQFLEGWKRDFLDGNRLFQQGIHVQCQIHEIPHVLCLEHLDWNAMTRVLARMLMENAAPVVGARKDTKQVAKAYVGQLSVCPSRIREHRTLEREKYEDLIRYVQSSEVVSLAERSIATRDCERTGTLNAVRLSPGIDFGARTIAVPPDLEYRPGTLLECAESMFLKKNAFENAKMTLSYHAKGEILLLKAMVVPHFPSSFLYLAKHDIFAEDYCTPIRLSSQPYEIDVVMSCEDGPMRRHETGHLEQIVLFLLACPSSSREAEEIEGCLPFVDVPSSTHQAAFRVFFLGRKMSVLLLERNELGRIEQQLNFEAKPFYSKEIRYIFEKKAKVISYYDFDEHLKLGAGRMVPSTTSSVLIEWPADETWQLNRKYGRLLVLEQMQHLKDIKRYDMHCQRMSMLYFDHPKYPRLYHFGEDVGSKENVKYRVFRGCLVERLRGRQPSALSLEIPGIIEGHPSVAIGSLCYVRQIKDPHTEMIMVCVGVDGNRIFLLPPIGFWESSLAKYMLSSSYEDEEINAHQLISLRFGIDHQSFKMMHEGINYICELGLDTNFMMLPSQSDVESKMRALPPAIEVLEAAKQMNSDSMLNPEQRLAIASILKGAGSVVPFALEGPPGTGKTLTLCSCVLEVLQMYPEARILCSAPLDFSADVLCSELSKRGLRPGQMFRLNNPKRPIFTLKGDIQDYCLIDDSAGIFALPEYQKLQQYTVIVSTCIGSYFVPRGSRTHVFIDEAGQATIPETSLSISTLSLNSGFPGGVLLCGDFKQLGPIVRSSQAISGGLSRSLLETLTYTYQTMEDKFMEEGYQPPRAMLVRNYRSCFDLLSLPSTIFYGGKLQAASCSKDIIPPLFCWDGKAQVQCPLVFYSVLGKQQQEGDSQSLSNRLEAVKLVTLIVKLLDSGVPPVDIGVIATYRLQVYLIRELLRKEGYSSIRVGTVLDFQGQETRIVFISTVNSSPHGMDCMPVGSGILHDANRFNVAITRAKAMLVVVGHPVCLQSDWYWKQLIHECATRGLIFGAGSEKLLGKVNEKTNDGMDTIIQLMAGSVLGGGDRSRIFPETLGDLYEAHSEATPWRLML